MSADFNLLFKFKGNRDYVHGTDIFQAAVNRLRKEGFNGMEKIELSFHKIIRSNLRCRLIQGATIGENADFAAKLSFRNGGADYIVLMSEDGTDIKERYSYSEDEITDASRIEIAGKKITLASELEYATIEKIVALNKFLLTKLFSDQEGKWYFGKIEVQNDLHDLPGNSIIELTLERNLGVKFTKSAITMNGERVGFIYFSMRQ